MSKKLLGLVAGLAIALSVAVVPVVAEEANLQDMSNEQLIALIQQLLGGSTTTTTTTTTTPATTGTSFAGIPSGFQFNTNLSQGMTGNDVKYLQIVLNSDSATAVATTGVGSAGNESTYFGSMTKAAVVKFQNKYASSILTPLGLSQGTGFVGTTTRAKLNELLAAGTSTPVSNLPAGCTSTTGFSPVTGESCSSVSTVVLPEGCTSTTGFSPVTGQSCSGTTTTTPTVTPVTGAGMTVALASDSPNGTTLVTGQAIAPLAKFVLTNKDSVEAKVTTLKLQRIGVSADTTLDNVYLYNGTTRLTDAATIRQGIVTFNNPNGVVTIPAGNSVTLTVVSNILTGTSGQTVGVALKTLTSSVEVKTTLPIQGGIQTIAPASLAGVTLGTILPSSSTTVNAGTTNYTVVQLPLTVTTRKVNLGGVAFKVIGSIPTDALENIQLYVNGIAVGNPASIDADNMVRFVLDTPYEIQSGSATLEVRANVVKGSSRNFSFSLQNATDLVLTDSVYNVNAIATGAPKTTATVSINSGTVSVTTDATFNATSVTGGTSNAVIGKYNFKAFGEDVKISYLDVNFTGQGTLDNVVIYANGAPITSNQNYTGTQLHFSLGSSLVVPANTTVSVEVRADTKAAGANVTSGSVAATLIGYTNNAQGVSSSTLSTVPATNIAGPTLTIGSGSLSLAASTGVAAKGNITPNTNNQRIGSFVITAGSSEAVRISNISVALGGTASLTSLSNLYIKYNGVSSTPINPQASNNFSVNIELGASESVTVDVYADTGSASSTGSTLAVEASGAALAGGADPVSAVAQVNTVTVGGTGTGTYALTINGAYYSAAWDTNVAKTATALAAVINADGTAVVTADASAADGTFTVTANDAGEAFTISNFGAVPSTNISVASTTPNRTAVTGVAESGTVTITGTPVVGDIVTVTLGGTAYTHTVTAKQTAAQVATSVATLVDANDSHGASADGGVITITDQATGAAGNVSLSTAATKVGGNVQATLGMTATGVSSNSSISVAALAGQTMTITSATLATPTLATSSSPAAQFVLAGSEDALVATYNFVASNGDVTIDELGFETSNNAITEITVNGQSVPVAGNAATLVFTSANKPVISAGYGGENLEVKVNYNTVGLGGGITANTTSTLTLTSVKYTAGNTTTTITPEGGVPARQMTVVGAVPTVTLSSSTETLQNQTMEIAKVKVASTGGKIVVNELPISISTSGSVKFTDHALVVKVGSTSLTTSDTFDALGANDTGTGVITISGGYEVPANGEVTFSIFATPDSADADDSVSTRITPAKSFAWKDVTGNVTGIDGQAIYNYPTSSVSVSN